MACQWKALTVAERKDVYPQPRCINCGREALHHCTKCGVLVCEREQCNGLCDKNQKDEPTMEPIDEHGGVDLAKLIDAVEDDMQETTRLAIETQVKSRIQKILVEILQLKAREDEVSARQIELGAKLEAIRLGKWEALD